MERQYRSASTESDSSSDNEENKGLNNMQDENSNDVKKNRASPNITVTRTDSYGKTCCGENANLHSLSNYIYIYIYNMYLLLYSETLLYI